MSRPKTGVIPSFRIGDLLWCRERSNTKLWWPAMVTYDPKLGIYFRTNGNRVSQYHVQYFGIAAVRGWVSPQAIQEVKDIQEKPAPAKGVGKKLQAEYEVAMKEVSEGFPLNHKQRKLKFIFDFGPSSPKPQSKQTKQKPTTLPVSIPLPGKAFGAKSYRQTKSGGGESRPTRARRELKASPSQLLDSPSLSSSQSSIPDAVQRPPLSNRPMRSTKRPRPCDSDIEALPPAKRQALDASHVPVLCDNSSEVSAPSIISAILTPPSSCSEDTPSVNFEFEQSEKEVQKSRGSQAPKAIKGKPKSDKPPLLVKGTCSICDDNDTNLLLCKGKCYRTFHLDCLGLMQLPDFRFVCDECLTSRNECFVCKKSDGELYSCNKPKCTKVYHLSCIEANKLFTFEKRSSKNFTCALHFCARCTSIGTSHVNHYNLIQCIKCPLALHRPDCFIAGCEVIDPTHMICYQHLRFERKSSLYSHLNINTCLECGESGTLFCCDICSAAYHMLCLDEESRPNEDAKSWSCPSCVVHDLPTYGSMVLCKFSIWKWWPGEVVLPNAIPDNLLPKKAGQCMFVVKFCGSNDYCWTYHGRTLPYTLEEDVGEATVKKRKGWSPKKCRHSSDSVFQKALVEAEELCRSKQAAREARKKPESKQFYKIKSNKYLVPRPQSIKEWRSISCQCTPENPCNDDSTCVNRAIYVECDPDSCPVGKLCQNQRILKCQNADTTPFYTGNRGWGLKPTHAISEGDFVVEYVGEILDVKMCRERLMKSHENNTTNFYMLTLDTGLVIDASQKSNHARFMNHSCDPNCETQKWTVHGETRIGIFARQDIPAGTELTFDYHLDSLGNDKKRCLCGSKNCSGFLGLKSKVEPQRSNPQVKKERENPGKKKGAKSKRKPSLKRPMKVPEPEVDRHEDDCFVCGDGGELLLCDNKGCSKAYHLACIGRKIFPPHHVTWECPRHYCQVCQKRAITFCSSCPTSYCHKHNIARFTEVGGKFQCFENCINMDIATQPKIEPL